ncbi:hypothetical protein HK104_009145 [Borealophlyctis nickersoniae]|nr:hypothetical protein HK104_009145 [Borealophlyctis nickersoniae]
MFALDGLPDDFSAPPDENAPPTFHPLAGAPISHEQNNFNPSPPYATKQSSFYNPNTNGYYNSDYGYSSQPPLPAEQVYQQDTAAGPDAAGNTAVSHVTPPMPVYSTHSSYPAHTVSSGAGPSYVPDGVNDSFGGTYTLVPVPSKLFASYVWVVQGFHQVSDEKLVSPPFGPEDWRWQLVIYPKGAGDGAGTHISGFIRPLKSEAEIAAGDAWVRPIKEFSFRVRRAIPGSPVMGLSDPNEDFLVADTSDPSFDAFSAGMTGWGFPELLDLNNLSDAVTYDGTLTIEADVIGDLTNEWALYQYQWDIPSFLQLTEDEALSQPFGTADCQWRIQLFRQGNKEGQGTHLSAFLIPHKSEREIALGDSWSRPIVSLTIKIRTSNSAEVVISKTLTGGYIYGGVNLSTGWAQLVELSRLNEILDWYGTLSIQAEVMWDPTFGSSGTELGRVRDALADAAAEVPTLRRAVEGLREELDGARGEVVNVRAELTASHNELDGVRAELGATQADLTTARSQVESLGTEAENLRTQVESAESKIAALQKIEAKYAFAQKELSDAYVRLEEGERVKERLAAAKAELQAVRNSQDTADGLRVKLAEVKATLSALRAGMEDGAVLEAKESDEEDAASLKAKLLQVQSDMARSAADLAATQVELDQKTRAMTDAAIFAPTKTEEPDESVSDLPPLPAALRSVRNELLVAKAVLEDAGMPETETERAALSAEVTMVMAELDVARAALVDAVSKLSDGEISPVDDEMAQDLEAIKRELSTVRAQLAAARSALDDGFGAMDPSIVGSGTQTPEGSVAARQQGPEVDHPPMGGPPISRDNAAVNAAPFGDIADQASRALQKESKESQLHSRPPSAQPPHSLESDAELLATRAHLATVESELSEFKIRMAAVRDMLTGTSGVPSAFNNAEGNALFERLFDRRMSAASAVPTEHPPDSWTPPEPVGPVGLAEGVSSKELASLLKAVQKQQSRSTFPSIYSILSSLAFLWLLTYSTVRIVCDPNTTSPSLQAYSDVCRTTVVPAWEGWQSGVEKIVADVVPGVIDGVGRVGGVVKGAALKVRKEVKGALGEVRKGSDAVRQPEPVSMPQEREVTRHTSVRRPSTAQTGWKSDVTQPSVERPATIVTHAEPQVERPTGTQQTESQLTVPSLVKPPAVPTSVDMNPHGSAPSAASEPSHSEAAQQQQNAREEVRPPPPPPAPPKPVWDDMAPVSEVSNSPNPQVNDDAPPEAVSQQSEPASPAPSPSSSLEAPVGNPDAPEVVSSDTTSTEPDLPAPASSPPPPIPAATQTQILHAIPPDSVPEGVATPAASSEPPLSADQPPVVVQRDEEIVLPPTEGETATKDSGEVRKDSDGVGAESDRIGGDSGTPTGRVEDEVVDELGTSGAEEQHEDADGAMNGSDPGDGLGLEGVDDMDAGIPYEEDIHSAAGSPTLEPVAVASETFNESPEATGADGRRDEL